MDKFAGVFGAAFDGSIATVANSIEPGEVTLAGIPFRIVETPEAFDVEIPEINTVYTHMLGHDCHSIVAGAGHADGMIAQLEGYLKKGYELILSSHYTPKDLKDVETKIAYLQELKAIAANVKDADGFKAAVTKNTRTTAVRITWTCPQGFSSR